MKLHKLCSSLALHQSIVDSHYYQTKNLDAKMGNSIPIVKKSHHNTGRIQIPGTKYFLLKILTFLSKNPFQPT